MISAESQGRRGTEPRLVAAMSPSEPAGESGAASSSLKPLSSPSGKEPWWLGLLRARVSAGLCVHVGTCVAM